MIRRWLRRVFGRRRAAVPVLMAPASVLDEVRSSREPVAGRVATMAQTGALDSGNGDALDAWLERLRATWRARLADERARSVAAAEARLEDLRAEALRTRMAAEASAAEVADTRRAVELAREDILGPAAEPARPRERRRRPRPTTDPLEGLVPHWLSTVLLFALLGLAIGGDLATFYLVLAGFFVDGGAFVIWALTLAFAAASVGLMHGVGRALRNLREGRGGLGHGAITLMGLGWAVVGAVAVWFRWQANTPLGGTDSIFADDAAAEALAAHDALLSAVLLAGLFIASGLLAFYTGYSEHHPRTSAYRKLRDRLVRQQKQQAKDATAEIRAKEALAHALGESTRAQRREDAGRAEVDAMIDELKELVRVLVAQHIGLPEATNGLTTGRSAAPGDRVQPVSVASVPVPTGGAAPDVVRIVSSDVLWPSSNGHGSMNGHGSLNGSAGGGQA
jgi:hypothetical protein